MDYLINYFYNELLYNTADLSQIIYDVAYFLECSTILFCPSVHHEAYQLVAVNHYKPLFCALISSCLLVRSA